MPATAETVIINQTPYQLVNIQQRPNSGKYKLSPMAVCAVCGEKFKDDADYIVNTLQNVNRKGPGFYYQHVGCEQIVGGSGWGIARIGKRVLKPTEVKIGDVLLDYSIQFGSFNVVRVTKTHWPAEPANLKGKKFYGIFVDPDDYSKVRAPGDDDMCFWHHELTGHTELYRAVLPDPMPKTQLDQIVEQLAAQKPSCSLMAVKGRTVMAVEGTVNAANTKSVYGVWSWKAERGLFDAVRNLTMKQADELYDKRKNEG